MKGKPLSPPQHQQNARRKEEQEENGELCSESESTGEKKNRLSFSLSLAVSRHSALCFLFPLFFRVRADRYGSFRVQQPRVLRSSSERRPTFVLGPDATGDQAGTARFKEEETRAFLRGKTSADGRRCPPSTLLPLSSCNALASSSLSWLCSRSHLVRSERNGLSVPFA